MPLLVDTDAFCKLGVAGLLKETAGLVGANLSDCHRLPALPHMLRKGSLPRRYGANTCEALIESAEKMMSAPPIDVAKLEPFVSIADIDPGEAQLLASVANSDSLLVSGDKRALRAIKGSPDLVSAIGGRVMTIEAALLGIADRIGLADLRTRASLVAPFDQTFKVCFSPSNEDPLACLHSYFTSLQAEVHPLALWAMSKS